MPPSGVHGVMWSTSISLGPKCSEHIGQRYTPRATLDRASAPRRIGEYNHTRRSAERIFDFKL